MFAYLLWLCFALLNISLIESQTSTTKFPFNNYTASCPLLDVTSPCKCTLFHGIENELQCDAAEQSINLPQICQHISDYMEKEGDRVKHFSFFTLSNKAIEVLENNTFRGLNFAAIYIMGPNNLSKIAKYAFSGTTTQIEKYYQEGSNRMTESAYEEFFEALRSLVNLKNVMFMDHNLKLIPENAFNTQTDSNGLQKLEKVVFNVDGVSNRGAINRIGKRAFYSLNYLKELNIAQQEINRIVNFTFEFSKSSSDTLKIYLNNNRLNGSSFEYNAFANIKRPVLVNLNDNSIDYVDESAFRQLLSADKKNVITLSGNRLNCNDCRTVWLYREKTTFSKQVENAFCANSNVTIWDNNSNLSRCAAK